MKGLGTRQGGAVIVGHAYNDYTMETPIWGTDWDWKKRP